MDAIKKLAEQLKIIREELHKVEGKAPAPKLPAQPQADIRDQNHAHLTNLFGALKSHHQNGEIDKVKELRGQIREHVLTAPPGSVHVGKLGELMEDQHRGKDIHRNTEWPRKAVINNDFNEMLNHHVGEAKSIKDIYDNYGGEKAITALMKTMGSNGTPRHYSELKFKRPGVHEDLLDLVWPGKAKTDREEGRHLGILPRTFLGSDYKTPEAAREGKRLQKRVDDTYGPMTEWDGQGPSREAIDAHEDAVVARGLHKFKHHYGL